MMTQQEVLQQAHDDLYWAQTNTELAEMYRGELVVVHQRKVIAHGTERGDLLKEVADRGLLREEVVIVPMLPLDFEAPPDLSV